MLNDREQIALLSIGPPCNKNTDRPQYLVSIPHHYSWIANIIQTDGLVLRTNLGSVHFKPSCIVTIFALFSLMLILNCNYEKIEVATQYFVFIITHLVGLFQSHHF